MNPRPSLPRPRARRWRPDWPGALAAAVLALGTFAVYCRTLAVPLLLDDHDAIAGNLSIRRLWPIGTVLSPPNGTGVGGRPFLNLTYALNYAAGGTAVAGYHRINLLIHVLAAWVLFLLVRRTLRGPLLSRRFGSSANALALAVGAIWAWHPVQTESVTYLSQRAESLMGLLYLLTLYCFARGAEAARRGTGRIWFGLSFASCLAGMATKEVMVTAPLLALLYDRTFLAGSFAAAWRTRKMVFLALAATWIPLGCLMAGIQARGAGFGQHVTAGAYALAESRAVVRYLQLGLWPSNLVFDYGSFVPVRAAAVWPEVLAVTGLAAAAGLALRQWPALGFPACWFLLILAPTSSVVPVALQPVAENRLYLPLAGLAVLAVLGSFYLAGRRAYPWLALAAGALGWTAAERNQVYLSERALWTDTLAKAPQNARALNNLASNVLLPAGQAQEAIADFEAALRLQPDFPEVHDNLARSLAKLPGRLDDALAESEAALRQAPNYAAAHATRGYILALLPGRRREAIAEDETALRLQPDLAEAHTELALAWADEPGKLPAAIAEGQAALRLDPNSAEAHFALGYALAKLPGRLSDAIAEYQQALRLNPDLIEAHYNLGGAWLSLPGHRPEAIAEYQSALRLKPDLAEGHFSLGTLWLAEPGRLPEAIAEFSAALRLKPDYAEAHANLANALMQDPARRDEAIAHYQAALRLKPDVAELHGNLGLALSGAGRTREAIAEFETALRLKPDLAQAHFYLAGALLASPGGAAAARSHLEAVLRLQPENASARRILEELQAARK